MILKSALTEPDELNKRITNSLLDLLHESMLLTGADTAVNCQAFRLMTTVACVLFTQWLHIQLLAVVSILLQEVGVSEDDHVAWCAALDQKIIDCTGNEQCRVVLGTAGCLIHVAHTVQELREIYLCKCARHHRNAGADWSTTTGSLVHLEGA